MAKPIKIEFLGDEKDFLRSTKKVAGGLQDVEDAVDDVNIKFDDSDETGTRAVNSLNPKFATLATAIGGAFAVDTIVDFGTEMFGLASDLELTNRKISTVFGDQADDITDWADSVNESFGTSTTQVANLAAGVADLIKPMGATTEEAAAMSQEIVGLAPALAQWSAGQYDAAEVSEILASAMLGEREQLKGLGISISQAEVDQRALQIAQEDGRDAVTQMDEALATQQLIFEKSTDAQAGYTAGTETLSGQQANLQAKLTELKEFLATKLAPVFLAIGSFITDTLVPAVQSWIAKVQELRPTIEEWADKLQSVTDHLQPLVDWMQKVVGGPGERHRDDRTQVHPDRVGCRPGGGRGRPGGRVRCRHHHPRGHRPSDRDRGRCLRQADRHRQEQRNQDLRCGSWPVPGWDQLGERPVGFPETEGHRAVQGPQPVRGPFRDSAWSCVRWVGCYRWDVPDKRTRL